MNGSKPIVTIYPTALREIERSEFRLSRVIDVARSVGERFGTLIEQLHPEPKGLSSDPQSETEMYKNPSTTALNFPTEPQLMRLAAWHDSESRLRSINSTWIIHRTGATVDVGWSRNEAGQFEVVIMSAGTGREHPDHNDYEM